MTWVGLLMVNNHVCWIQTWKIITPGGYRLQSCNHVSTDNGASGEYTMPKSQERNYLNPWVNNIWKPSPITWSNKFLFFFNNFELDCPSRDHCALEHNGRQSLWLSDIKTAFNYFQCYFKFNPWDPVYTLLIPHFLTFLWLLQGSLFGFKKFIFPDLCSHGTLHFIFIL